MECGSISSWSSNGAGSRSGSRSGSRGPGRRAGGRLPRPAALKGSRAVATIQSPPPSPPDTKNSVRRLLPPDSRIALGNAYCVCTQTAHAAWCRTGPEQQRVKLRVMGPGRDLGSRPLAAVRRRTSSPACPCRSEKRPVEEWNGCRRWLGGRKRLSPLLRPSAAIFRPVISRPPAERTHPCQNRFPRPREVGSIGAMVCNHPPTPTRKRGA